MFQQEKSIDTANFLSDTDDPSVPNNGIEIIFDEDLHTVVSQNTTQENIVDFNTDDVQTLVQNPTGAKSNWAKYKANDLSKSIISRPHSTIQTMSSSTLHDKYDQLVDRKLII